MRKILIVLFLSIFTMTAWAIQYPQRTITDSDGDQLAITSEGGIIISPGGSVVVGQTVIASKGVAIVLGSGSSAIVVKQIQLIAHTDNVDELYAGPSTVATTTGVRIASQSYLILDVDNTADVYIVGNTASTSVTYIGIVE